MKTGCSDKETQMVDFGCCELPNIDYSEGCSDKILIVGISGLSENDVKRATEAVRQAMKNVEDMNSILPFNLMKDSIEKIRIHNSFKEKPQKRNFVNKFNKNQHRKK